ncbi:MAG: SDR family oxidoreductase [Thermoplasmataceae archaeon]
MAKREEISEMFSLIHRKIVTAALGTTCYAMSKAAVIMLTKRLDFEFGVYGIRMNAISLG